MTKIFTSIFIDFNINNLALWGTFLSGLGALAALLISLKQIKRNSNQNEANFWLKLREMFNTSDRSEVHRDLRKGKWKETAPTSKDEWVKIEDYLGTFEVCEGMLQKKIISSDVFKNLYEYRIYNILQNKALAKNKLIFEYYDWKTFYKLLARLYGDDWDKFYNFLCGINPNYNEIKKESDILSKMNEAEKTQYHYFTTTLKLN